MFRGNELVVQTVGFLVRHIHHTLDAWGYEDLTRATTIDVGLWACSQLLVDSVGKSLDIDL